MARRHLLQSFGELDALYVYHFSLQSNDILHYVIMFKMKVVSHRHPAISLAGT